jgi:hypothetical protein
MKRFSGPYKIALQVFIGALLIMPVVLSSSTATAQPIVDSVRAMQLRNEKMYRAMNQLDAQGASYEFTNVTAWHITDDDLLKQIKDVYMAKYKETRLKDFDIDDIYVFAAPAGPDHFEPFHVLFMGKHIKTDTSGGGDLDPFFGGGGKRRNTTAKIPIAFIGKDVIRLMRQQPALLDNINATQGEIVELPGDIMPSGVQLVKSSAERYVFHEMFNNFYAKRQIVDEQNRALGLPTSDEQFAAQDTSGVAGNQPIEVAVRTDPDQSTALPDEQLTSRAFRYGKTIDISINHLLVNASRSTAIELELGLPEVGLPFWTAGEGRLWLNLKNSVGTESNFKIGLDFPLNLGNEDAAIFKARQLSGFFGGSIDAYFAGIDFFSGFNMPIAFNFTILPAGGSNSSIIYNGASSFHAITKDGTDTILPGNRSFYRSAFIGQFYIPIIVQLDPSNFLQFSAGVGLHKVYQSWIPNATDVDAKKNRHPFDAALQDKVQDIVGVSTPVTPHVGLEYVNHRSSKFGLSLFYDHLFTFGGWIELIEDHLRLETSYTAPLVRDPKPYEPPYFFSITPRIYF